MVESDKTLHLTRSVIDYLAVFRSHLLKRSNVSDAEALDYHVTGLKQGMHDFILIHDPKLLCKVMGCYLA